MHRTNTEGLMAFIRELIEYFSLNVGQAMIALRHRSPRRHSEVRWHQGRCALLEKTVDARLFNALSMPLRVKMNSHVRFEIHPTHVRKIMSLPARTNITAEVLALRRVKPNLKPILFLTEHIADDFFVANLLHKPIKHVGGQ